jgi:hypothetical protein
MGRVDELWLTCHHRAASFCSAAGLFRLLSIIIVGGHYLLLLLLWPYWLNPFLPRSFVFQFLF